MSLVRRAAQQVGAGLSLADFDRVLDLLAGGAPTYTGKAVSQETALAVSMVWTCCNTLANDIAQIPLVTKRDLTGTTGPSDNDDGSNKSEDAKDHYLWNLLQHEANPEMTAFRFKHIMQLWMMLWGNAYAEIEISGRGQVVALWPWRPDRVKITREGSISGPLRYTYTNHQQQKFTVPQDRMLHLRGMSLDGVLGLSPIEYHKQTIGMDMAMEEHGARFFSSGARPLGILTTTQKLSDPARNRLMKDWKHGHQGLDNAHRLAILEEGLTWQDVGTKMVDAQYIESREFTQADIARMYNMPGHRVGLMASSTNNNVEEMAVEYVQYTLGPLAENWQAECRFALLSPFEAQTISVQYDFGKLLRGDHDSIGKFIATLRQWGIANADECRRKFLGWNPIDDDMGKAYWQPSNMMPEGGGDGKTPAVQGMQQVTPKKKPAPAATPAATTPAATTEISKVNGLAH